ncbi:MAG: hypothetical protein JRC60_04480 [Deltaproteobacteria bacterium]|nr:hypothetical protein [Deltaproteobacteria bacterium]
MKSRHKKVVGYFAIQVGTPNIVCDGDACVIAGSQKALNRYIKKMIGQNISDYQIRKTRYGEILQGMRMGGVYTFDSKAYKNFLPLAKADGMPLAEFQFREDPKPHEDAVRLLRVQWIEPS